MKYINSLNHVLFLFSVAFLLTFTGARIFNLLWPEMYISWAGVHTHHFLYGIIFLTISGILPHVFRGPRARPLIILLHGFAAGLTFDEAGMWIHLSDDDPIRWKYNGLIIVMTGVMVTVTAKPAVLFIKNHFPFKKRPI